MFMIDQALIYIYMYIYAYTIIVKTRLLRMILSTYSSSDQAYVVLKHVSSNAQYNQLIEV